MDLNFSDAENLYKEYAAAERTMAGYYVRLPEDVNVLDPLFLLERINERPTFSKKVEMVTNLISGKKVEIWYQPEPLTDESGTVKEAYEPEKVHGFVFNGTGSIGALFTDKPYLLQVLIDYCYALVLKKLTPPSRGSKEVQA